MEAFFTHISGGITCRFRTQARCISSSAVVDAVAGTTTDVDELQRGGKICLHALLDEYDEYE